jgi:hypothetical protein
VSRTICEPFRAGWLVLGLAALLVAGCESRQRQAEVTAEQARDAVGSFVLKPGPGHLAHRAYRSIQPLEAEIVPVERVGDGEHARFPGQRRHLVTLRESGTCDGRPFTLERDFLLVCNGPESLRKDSSGTWSVWRLGLHYIDTDLSAADDFAGSFSGRNSQRDRWFLFRLGACTFLEKEGCFRCDFRHYRFDCGGASD